ncbi:MAG: hypothetical protein H7Y22_12755 [Gemmatimonadaceae bacterium]|nr:hypothetical protein [Gloeobacterales cyanobacterium ES-bin-141]
MLSRLRELRTRYFTDLDTMEASSLEDLSTEANGEESLHATLTDTNAVETEAEIAAAGESVDPEVRTEVQDLYRRFLGSYEYVKEANEKFLAMLDEALLEDPSLPEQQSSIRAFAESLMLDPIDQPMAYSPSDQDDIIDDAQALTEQEALLFGDAKNLND